MPDLQPHQRLGASRRSVDRAGDLLRDWRRSGSILLSPDEQEAESLVERYRHEFEVPLTKVVMGLRSFLATEDLAIEVGQRLSDTYSEWPMLSTSGTDTSRSSDSSKMNSRCWNGRPHGG